MYVNFGKVRTSTCINNTPFSRKQDNELLLIIVNFDQKAAKVSINIPSHAFDFLQIPQKESYLAKELLTGNEETLSLLPYSPTETVVEGMNGKILKFIL